MSVVINGTTGITSVNGSAAAPSVTGADTDTGIVYGTNTLSLATGGTAAVTVDSSQNVGIGTSSLNFEAGGGLVIYKNGNQARLILRNDYTGSTSTDGFQIIQQGTESGNANVNLNQYENAAMLFSTNATERARIDSSGNLLVGTTSQPSNGPYRTVLDGGTAVRPLACKYDSTGGSTQVAFINPNGQIGAITTTGSSTAFVTSSDYRLKENIQPMTGALAKVQALKPVTYKWKVDGSDGEGFIAHELAEVVPACVTGEKDAVDAEGNPVYQGIDTSFLVATLTAAIQELKAELDAAKADIAALKAPQ